MTAEFYWLTYTIILTALLWVPYILNRLAEGEKGPVGVLLNPQPARAPKALWATRLMRAHANAVENLVIFAPLVLMLHQLGISNTTTVNACIIYFFARLVHVIVYTLGIPFVRTLAFAAGCACQLALAGVLLGIS